MTVEEMKQRLEELRSEKDAIVSKELNLYGGLERLPTYYLKRMREINAESDGLQAKLDAARRVAEAAEAAVKSFRLRVIDAARQTWIHTPEDDKTDIMLKWAFEGAEYFERAADNYLKTGKHEGEQ